MLQPNSFYSESAMVIIRIFQHFFFIFNEKGRALDGIIQFYDRKTRELIWSHRIFNPNDSIVENKIFNQKKVDHYSKKAEESLRRLLNTEIKRECGAIDIAEENLIIAMSTNLGEKIDEAVLIIFALLNGWLDKESTYEIIKKFIQP